MLIIIFVRYINFEHNKFLNCFIERSSEFLIQEFLIQEFLIQEFLIKIIFYAISFYLLQNYYISLMRK